MRERERHADTIRYEAERERERERVSAHSIGAAGKNNAGAVVVPAVMVVVEAVASE